MTNTNLERAKEIKYEIDELKRSLSQITHGKLFDINTSAGCMRGHADPFLATVENDIKTYANSKILEKIELLETEFKAL